MANEKRLIDANDLKWKIGQVRLYVASLRCGKTIISKILESYQKCVFEEIDNAPTVDAVEVVHGRWERTEHHGFLRCSKCKDVYIDDSWVADGKVELLPQLRCKDGRRKEIQ